MKKGILKRLSLCGAMLAASYSLSAQHSGTVPVMYINSDTEFTTLDRETYVDATYYIDNCGVDWASSLGSKENPLTLQLKGRGNYTWVGFDKKPLRLLLDTPAEMCGLKENNYFGLFAHADDELGFMRNLLGFELARSLKMDWTPSQQPVELYYNGEYRGLYFCTELVRVEPDRVNVYKQADEDDSDVTGGWLCEIDNYDTDPHIKFTEGNGQSVIISRKTPLNLSAAQEQYLKDQMSTINKLIYAADKNDCQWAQYVDLTELAKFYVVNEIMDDYESFHGSCLFHKDRGEDAKWKFGPVWDFGSSMKRGSGKFIYKDAQWSQIWIGEMCKFPAFQEEVKKVWAEFCANEYDKVEGFLTDWCTLIKDAAVADYARWPQYGNNDLDADLEKVIFKMRNKSRWLGSQWGTAPDDVPYEAAQDVYLRGQFNDWGTTHQMTKGENNIYTIEVADLSGEIKVADADWSDLIMGGDGTKRLQCGEVFPLKSGTSSSNIEIFGGIKNALVTFDAVAETLLITGEYYPIEQGDITYEIFFRGDLNNWEKTNPMVKGEDGIYRCEIDNLTKRFKIADSGYSTINLGGDNVTLCYPGVKYNLVKKGKNITMGEDVEKALVEVDLENLTVLVTDISAEGGVDEITFDDTESIYFNLQGVRVNPSEANKGLYIRVCGGKARKIML